MNEDWKENPELKNMDKSKLDMLQQLADQGVGKNPSDMLMEAASRGKKNGLNFSQTEISAILDVLKEGKSPKEQAKMDRIIGLMRMIR